MQSEENVKMYFIMSLDNHNLATVLACKQSKMI